VEETFDLLSADPCRPLCIKEDPSIGVYLKDLSFHVVSSWRDVASNIQRGKRQMNRSKNPGFRRRSHTILSLRIEAQMPMPLPRPIATAMTTPPVALNPNPNLKPEAEEGRCPEEEGIILERNPHQASVEGMVPVRISTLTVTEMASCARDRSIHMFPSESRLQNASKVGLALSAWGNVISSLARKSQNTLEAASVHVPSAQQIPPTITACNHN
jgi:hypothetical protein